MCKQARNERAFVLMLSGLILVVYGAFISNRVGICQLRAQRETISIKLEGGNQEDMTLLMTNLKNELSSRFDIVEGLSDKSLSITLKPKGTRKWVADFVLADGEGVYNRKKAKEGGKKVIIEISYEAEIVFFDSKSAETHNFTDLKGSFENFPKNLLYRINKLYPVTSRIISLEKDRVTVDMGGNVGIRKGKRLEVFDSDNRKVGLIKVTNVGKEEFEAKIIRGNPKETYLVKPQLPLKGGVGLKYISFPTNIEPNPSYIRTSGQVPDAVGDIGFGMMLEGEFSPYYLRPLVFLLSSGYIKAGPLQGWQIINAGLMVKFEIMPDFLFLELGGDGGWNLVPTNLKWARPEETYNDNLGRNSGTTTGNNYWSYEGFGGLAFHLSRFVSLFGRVGYYASTAPSNYFDSQAPEGNKYYLDSSWLEYKFEKTNGIAFQGGITIWMVK